MNEPTNIANIAQQLQNAYAQSQTAKPNSSSAGGLGSIGIGGASLGSHYYPARQTCPNCGYCPHCGRSNGYYQQPYYWGNQNYQGGSQAIPMGSVQTFNQAKQG